VRTEARVKKQVSVAAYIAIFRNHSVGIEEGPFLSANKLTAGLKRGWEGEHELPAADVRAFADATALADTQRAKARKAPRRPGAPAETQQKSPWRNFGI
jgi:hypothetical protein